MDLRYLMGGLGRSGEQAGILLCGERGPKKDVKDGSVVGNRLVMVIYD